MSRTLENPGIDIQRSFVPGVGEMSVSDRLVLRRSAEKTEEGLRRSPEPKAEPEGKREVSPSVQMSLPGVGAGQPTVRNRRFTFDQFVVGPSNRFAYKAAWAVANERPRAYNPLYVYGESGLGKSHLCGAIGDRIRQTQPHTEILYTTAEEFLSEMVAAIRKNEMWAFKEKHRRRCDIVVIDGVHFFSGKQKTQSELSHTLDHLSNGGKQMILTGNVAPHEITHMSEGLKSRLGCGLVVDIQPPDFDTRKRILLHRADFDGVMLSEDVVEFLASAISGSVRRLEGLLVNLMAKSSLLFRPIDLELAQEVVRSFQTLENQKATITTIQNLVAKQFHIGVDQLTSRSRKKSICHPRQIAMYLCRKLTDEALDAIGRAFGRDHASVIHSIGVVERRIREKAGVRREIDFLVEKLTGQASTSS